MSYYLLPHISEMLKHENIDIQYGEISKQNTKIVKTSQRYLGNLKCEIEKFPNSWDIYKKYTNTYEYIHSQIPEQNVLFQSVNPYLDHILNLSKLQMFLIF